MYNSELPDIPTNVVNVNKNTNYLFLRYYIRVRERINNFLRLTSMGFVGKRGCECCFIKICSDTDSRFSDVGDTEEGNGSEHCLSILTGGTVR